jgi:hypothetical protein
VRPKPFRSQGKPGPKPNPLNKTNKAKAERALRMAQKKEAKFLFKDCKWLTSKFGGLRKGNSAVVCCQGRECVREYRRAAPSFQDFYATVRDYRKYYHSLDKSEQRKWWAQHQDFHGYEVPAKALRRGGRLSEWLCEDYTTMQANLNTVKSSDKLPPVLPSKMRSVCTKFLVYLTAGNLETAYRSRVRRAAFTSPGGATAQAFDCNLPVARKRYTFTEDGGRAPEKFTTCALWLQREGDLALVMPDDAIKVLPWRTQIQTHEALILDFEGKAGPPYSSSAPSSEDIGLSLANASLPAQDSDGEPAGGAEVAMAGESKDEDVPERPPPFQVQHLNADGNWEPADCEPDLVDECQEDECMEDEHEERTDAIRMALERTKPKILYRYGNRFLGVKGTKPELPGLPSLSTFNNAWSSDRNLRNIVCREHIPFAKCDFCVRHREQIEQKRSEEEREELNKKLQKHLEHVKAEKQYYYSNRRRSRLYPKKIISMIIDGADQSKHHIPHFKEKSHLNDAATRLKMHLYGAIVHGHGAWAFTMPDHEHQGHNTTIQVLHEVLLDIKKKQGFLPPVLKLQLDNTTKQNKGQFLFGYLAMLLEQGVFEEIELSFLPVGHTHEDIDQFFSRIAVYLR